MTERLRLSNRGLLVFALFGFYSIVPQVSISRAETILAIGGTYASFSDQLPIDFFIPSGPGEILVRTWAHSGGTAYPNISVSNGGIDAFVRLFDSSSLQIAADDDSGTGADSWLQTPSFVPGGQIIPALASGDYRLRQDVFGTALNNGTFAMNLVSGNGPGIFDAGYTIHGIEPTVGVNINLFAFGTQPFTTQSEIHRATLLFDSPSDLLQANNIELSGDHEVTLSAGTISSNNFLQAGFGYGGGVSLITLDGGDLITASSQRWGAESQHRTVIEHSAGTNTAQIITLAEFANNADATYNLSGSGVVSANLLLLGTGGGAPVDARFLQTGGLAQFENVSIGPFSPSGGSHIYRLSGGTAEILSLGMNSDGVFELSGGTLVMTQGAEFIYANGNGEFRWLSGTVRVPDFTLDGTAGTFFGPTLTLLPGQTLEVVGATDNRSILTLSGGTLITDSLSGPGSLQFYSGELQITGAAGLDIDSSGPLGPSVILWAGQKVTVTNTATITTGSLLSVGGGAKLTAGGVTNYGELHMDGPSAVVETSLVTNQHLIRGEGRISGGLNNPATGEFRAENGKRLKVEGVNNANAGLINLQGGTAEFSQALTNGSNGRIAGRGTLMTGGLTNNGHVALSSGVTDVFGDVINNTGNAAKGITVSGNADVTFWDDVNNVAGSLFRVSGGSSATFFGTYSGAGISGPGSVYFEADVTPGASPTTAIFGGNVSLAPTAMLQIELGGTSPGTGYDQVQVSGQLALDGTLNVQLIDLGSGVFTPVAGQSFNILDWGTLSGSFTAINLPTLEGLSWNTSQLYTTGVLSVGVAGLPGDYNDDGVVNAADYVKWRDQLGASASLPNDSTVGVDAGDYLVWRANFGAAQGSGAGLGENTAVPEPRSFLLAIFAGLALIQTRRIRGRRI